MQVIVYLSTLRDGTRLAAFAQDPLRTDGVMVDQHVFLDPGDELYGRPAGEWGDGRYRLEDGWLVRDEPGDPLTAAII